LEPRRSPRRQISRRIRRLNAGRVEYNKGAIAAAGAIEPLVALVRDGDAQGKANAANALWSLADGVLT
jgi:hypothetical protein